MITFGKTASKPNSMFGKLPAYFKENDSNKDGNNEGTLERYLEIFCAELDSNVSPYIDELLDITDAEALANTVEATITFDADLILNNSIIGYINGVSTNAVVFSTDHDTTMDLLITELESHTDVESAILTDTTNNRQIRIIPVVSLGPLLLTSWAVTLGLSQAGIVTITDTSGLTRANPTELLTHISELFGNPPDIGTGETYSGGEDEYIVLIRHLVHILKTKGTVKSLEYFLAIYGYEIATLNQSGVTISTYDASPTPIAHDDGATYDGGFVFYSGFDLVITDKAGMVHSPVPTQSWLDNYLKPAIQNLIAPIWATLGTITHTP